jgi:hypothetical protein
VGVVSRTVVVGGGLLGLLLVALLYLQPDVVLGAAPGLTRQVRSLDPEVALLGVVGALVAMTALKLLVTWLLYRGGDATESSSRSATTESLYGSGTAELDELGASVDLAFESALDYRHADESLREDSREALLSRLRGIAATAHAQSTGRDRGHAVRAVRTGDWTTDRRAAGLLAGDDGPSIPVHLWLLDLLLGRDPFAEAVERTVEAIADVHGDDLEYGGGAGLTREVSEG